MRKSSKNEWLFVICVALFFVFKDGLQIPFRLLLPCAGTECCGSYGMLLLQMTSYTTIYSPPPPPNKNVRSIPMTLSFSHPLGIMVWTARAAHWTMLNSLLKGGMPTFATFLTVWMRTRESVASWEPLSNFLAVFMHSCRSHLLHQGSLITHTIVYQPDLQAAEEKRERRKQKVARKQESASVAMQVIQHKEIEGYVLVYIDGSSEYVATVRWLGGWGCHSMDGWEWASHLPLHTQQTINRAELQAVIEVVVHHVSTSKVAVCMDSA